MLVQQEKIIHACNLTTEEVQKAMHAGGYIDYPKDVKFLGMNSMGFVYEVSYDSESLGFQATCRVFLKFVDAGDGVPELQGEY